MAWYQTGEYKPHPALSKGEGNSQQPNTKQPPILDSLRDFLAISTKLLYQKHNHTHIKGGK
jgi:hypothetical protein